MLGRGPRDRELARLVDDREHAERGEQDREIEFGPEEIDLEVPFGNVTEHSRDDPPVGERAAVLGDRVLGAGPAGDVGRRFIAHRGHRSPFELLVPNRMLGRVVGEHP